jgi:hypothetical protein
MHGGGMSTAWDSDPNRRAGGQAFVWAFCTYVVMLFVVLPREDAHSDTYLAGLLMAPAAIAWLLTWALAHNMDRDWRWWVYGLVVPPLVVALAVVSNLSELSNRAQGKAADGGTRADSGPVLHELGVPETQGAWTKVDSPEIQKAEGLLTGNLDQFGEDVESAVVGYYQHSTPAAGVMFVGINGTIEKGASLETTLRDALGADVDHYDTFNPGAAKGVLGCGNLRQQGRLVVGCLWIGNQRAVLTAWVTGDLDHEQAANLTAELRDLAAGVSQSPTT